MLWPPGQREPAPSGIPRFVTEDESSRRRRAASERRDEGTGGSGGDGGNSPALPTTGGVGTAMTDTNGNLPTPVRRPQPGGGGGDDRLGTVVRALSGNLDG